MTVITNSNKFYDNTLKQHQYQYFWIFIIKNGCLKTSRTCEIGLNKLSNEDGIFIQTYICHHFPSDGGVVGNICFQNCSSGFSCIFTSTFQFIRTNTY